MDTKVVSSTTKWKEGKMEGRKKERKRKRFCLPLPMITTKTKSG